MEWYWYLVIATVVIIAQILILLFMKGANRNV